MQSAWQSKGRRNTNVRRELREQKSHEVILLYQVLLANVLCNFLHSGLPRIRRREPAQEHCPHLSNSLHYFY